MSNFPHKSKAINGVGWSFFEAIGVRGVQFIIGIILARLLLPEQFGLISMLTIFIAVAQTFLDSGFGAALIQKPSITTKDSCSIFYFNILMGFAAAGILYVGAPLVASFYNQPTLAPLLRVMALILIINSFGLVHGVLLTRELNFKTQSKATLASSLFSGTIGVLLAWQGFGVWSLAYQQVSNAVFRVVFLWFFSKWRPSWIFSLQSLKEMFGFGSKLLTSSLLNTIFDNIYLIFIGKFFSAADLGYFTRANNLQRLPSSTLSGIISRVALPVFSSIQQNKTLLKRGMKKALSILVLINFPLMIGIAVTSRPLVLVLLTEKWLPCVPYLQLLSFAGLLYPLHLINLNVLQAMGRSDLFLQLEIIKKVLIALNIAITWRWGIMAMITGQVITSLICYYLNAYYNKELLDYSVLEQISDLYIYLLNAILMGIVVYSLSYLPFPDPLVLLVCQIPLGVIVYLISCRLLRLDAYIEIQEIIILRLFSKPSK